MQHPVPSKRSHDFPTLVGFAHLFTFNRFLALIETFLLSRILFGAVNPAAFAIPDVNHARGNFVTCLRARGRGNLRDICSRKFGFITCLESRLDPYQPCPATTRAASDGLHARVSRVKIIVRPLAALVTS